jgi:hypothetical protein
MGMGTARRVDGLVTSAIDAALGESTTPPPKRLYHYTSQTGLHGIVQSGAIFLSDARFLNDASEISYGRHAFLDGLRRATDQGLDLWGGRVLQDVLKLVEQPNIDTEQWSAGVFVASFCSDGNLLSQWRAYASSPGGCSIGFRTADLTATAQVPARVERPFGGPAVTLRRVLYDPDEQRDLIDRVVARTFSAAASINHLNTAVYLAHSLFYGVASAVIPQIKAPVFREEREWRLVCCATSGFDLRLSHRGIVPFILCKLGSLNEAAQWVLPIEELYVGPSHQVDLNHLAFRELLRASGISVGSATVKTSDVPLRS